MILDKLLYKLVRPLFRKWRDRRYAYTRLVEVFVYKNHLLHNLKEYQKIHPTSRIAPVLKSNAYGHGLIKVARIFDQPETPFLVVDGYYEALILRNEGVRARILVIGYTATENIVECRLKNVAFTILDLLIILCKKTHLPMTLTSMSPINKIINVTLASDNCNNYYCTAVLFLGLYADQSDMTHNIISNHFL